MCLLLTLVRTSAVVVVALIRIGGPPRSRAPWYLCRPRCASLLLPTVSQHFSHSPAPPQPPEGGSPRQKQPPSLAPAPSLQQGGDEDKQVTASR